MAYKFQFGPAVLSGSTTFKNATTLSAGGDFGDGNITNVGDIAVDSISADGNDIEVELTDNRSTAFVFKESTNLYMRFDTANTSEGVEIHQDLEMQSGTLFKMPDNTSGKILVADGTSFEEVAMSGDIAIAANGATTIQANAVEGSMLNNNIVSGLDDIGDAIAATDELIISDGGTIKRTDISRLSTYLADEGLTVGNNKLTLDLNGIGAAKTSLAQADLFALADSAGGDVTKKITFSNLEDAIFGNVSGDIAVAAGGAATIQSASVEGSMLNDNVVSGLTDIGAALVRTDELIVSDNGNIRRVDVERIGDFVGSGDDFSVTNGVLAIANNAVAAAEIATSVAGSGLTGGGGSALAVQVSGAIIITGDKVALTSSVAGTGLGVGATDGDVVSTLELDVLGLDAITSLAQADLVPVHDDGAGVKKITFSNFEDSIFGNVSGDATIAAGGALTIANTAVQAAMLNNDIVSGLDDIGADLQTTDELIVSDGGTIKRTDLSRLSTMMASTGLADSSGQLSVAAAQTSITSILNSSLGKIGTASDQEYIDFGTSNTIKLAINDATGLELDSSGVTIAGNLTVNGTTTTVNSTTINITSSFTFEGPADDHETTLGVVDPTADATIKLPAMSAGTYFLPVLAAASTTAISATPAELNILDDATITTAELNILDGNTAASSITVAAGDQLIINDGGNGGTMKQIAASTLKSYISGLDVALKANGQTLAAGVNYFASSSIANTTVTLPSNPAVGTSVMIKAHPNCASDRLLTVTSSGAHTIDGEGLLLLESNNAAVECVYVVANVWKVF